MMPQSADDRRPPCRTLIVEDYPVLGELLAARLSGERDFEVVGVARAAPEALEMLRATRPDLILLDLGLPSRNQGLQVAEQARRLLPECKILVFSAVGNMANVHRSVGAGVDGFVEKTAPWHELLAALQKVRAGEFYLSPAAAERLLESFKRKAAGAHLDEREELVLRRLSEGDVIKAIAGELGVGAPMLYKVLQSLRIKLDARSNEELVQRAYTLGYLEPLPSSLRHGPHGARPHRPGRRGRE